MTPPDKPKPDWEAIEREYRLGQYSLREIAKRHGVGHQSILRRAAKWGWTQDMNDIVGRKVGAQLLLSGPDHERTKSEPRQRAGPRIEITEEHIEAAVDEKVSIHVAHRSMARDFRALQAALVEEARRTTQQLADIVEDIDAETRGPSGAQRRARMMQAVSLPSRSSTLASLVSSGKNIQWIERLAHNLAPALPQDVGAGDTGPYQIVQFEDAAEA